VCVDGPEGVKCVRDHVVDAPSRMPASQHVPRVSAPRGPKGQLDWVLEPLPASRGMVAALVAELEA
jgi:hypothetical protein